MALPTTNDGVIKSINNVSLPKQPASFSLGIQAVNDADAGRAQSGKMYVGYIGTAKTLSCAWKTVTPDVASTILQACETDIYFHVVYWDTDLCIYRTSTFYVGDRTVDTVQFIDGREYVDLTLTFIERTPS